MTQLRLYNTLSRTIEPFAPADGRVARVYTCGPTVYNAAHLGNFRTFLFEDLLRRTLKYVCGWEVRQVMNLTDVDDKIIARAAREGVGIGELTSPIIDRFFADRDYLRIEAAELYPRATEYIAQMIRLVQRLEERGLAYKAEDGSVYFSIDRFPAYGRLSQLDRREVRSGARVSQDDYSKENAQDFALWKAAKPEDEATGAAWDSPWGRGRPGWHLECSAMAMHELGDTLDIHCGGVDLIFPHHEDEIAQSEGATGKPFSRFWCHGAFLLTSGAKMAKRVGNVWTIDDLRAQNVSGYAIRHFVFSTHYRKELNLVPDAVEGSTHAVRRLGEFGARLRGASGATAGLGKAAERAREAMRASLLDDLNAPEALAALFTFVREGNAELDSGGRESAPLARAREVFDLFHSVLEVAQPVTVLDAGSLAAAVDSAPPREAAPDSAASAGQAAPPGMDPALLAWAQQLLTERSAARRRRDFASSDRIRDELAEKGFVVEDTPDGPIVKLKR